MLRLHSGKPRFREMKNMKQKCSLLIVVLVLIVAFTGCSSIQLASSEANIRAKSFSAEEGKSVLYVIQDGGYGSGRALFQITVDGQTQGSLAGRTYHRLVLSPGRHIIVATSLENEQLLQIETTAGSLAFVSIPSVIGWMAMRVGDMQQLRDSVGKQAVLEADLARGIR